MWKRLWRRGKGGKWGSEEGDDRSRRRKERGRDVVKGSGVDRGRGMAWGGSEGVGDVTHGKK